MNRLLLIILFFIPTSILAQRHELRREGRVLAHSLSFDPNVITEDMPPSLQGILMDYATQPRYANRIKGQVVEPLLRSNYSQHAPFNGSCPLYDSQRCVVGCVATSLEQVMNYYHHPAELLDTLHGWETEHYTIPDVMPGTKIDWDNILDDYTQGYTEAQAKAVADLAYYCGVAAHMSWSPSASGASYYKAFNSLYYAFDYETIALIERAYYTNDTWNRLLRNELECGRPICFSGYNMALDGHAFNIDGVDAEGYYHCNWGYGGLYNGYFDLDYLNPFERLDDETDLGANEGFFSNQMALFMHPEDFVIDITDTLSLAAALQGVKIDGVTFRRTPDTNNYVVADFSLTNATDDTLNYTFEVLTYLPSDTAIFMQADYVGLSSVNLLPRESKSWPVYCRFSETGERRFAISADDKTFGIDIPITISQGTESKLSFGEFSCQDIYRGDNNTSTFTLPITNNASGGCAGDLLTFMLRAADSNEYQRHWTVLSLDGGETTDVEVTFQHLVDGQTYTIYVNDADWVSHAVTTFTYRKSEALDNIGQVTTNQHDGYYDLSGRKALNPLRGLYIRNGKKIWLRQ